MNIQIFLALAKHGDEVILLGVQSNSRLMEIIKDSFMMRADRCDWEVQTQTHELEIEWKEKEVKNDIPKKASISD